MNQNQYKKIETYMLSCMKDSAHDKEHVYRVLFTALDIASTEIGVNLDVLITACLLHDIGRDEQFANPELDHAVVGAEKAYAFLCGIGYEDGYAKQVADCIRAHRFRSDHPPVTMEEKILFDSDKVDVTGALGIARSLLFEGKVGTPLYRLDGAGNISDGTNDIEASFFHEYKHKLEGLYAKFYTRRGGELALERQKAAVDFYNSLLRETVLMREKGLSLLNREIYTNNFSVER